MVVLTPYLGQLVELQRALGAEWGVQVDDRDMNDLRQAMAEGAASAVIGGMVSKDDGKETGNRVRVATIDNYQGKLR